MVLGAFVIVIVGILIVNYFKDKRSESFSTGSLTTESAKTGEHIVVKGESLWTIAEDSFGSGYNWVDIKSANNLKTETLEIGQKLTIPEVASKKPTVTKVAVVSQTEKTITADTYTVEKGDTLWNISVRAYGDGYKWVKIARENKLRNPNLIFVGTVLKLPR